jgi:hypothetical protein
MLPDGELKTARALISNSAIFLFVMSALTAFMYLVGNYQNMSPSSLFILLKVLYALGIALMLLSTIAFLLWALARFLKRDIWRIRPMLIYGFLALAGLLFAMFAGSVILLAGGSEI